MANTYIDLNLSVLKHPTTYDVVKKYDIDAVRTAVKNILNTNKGEKLFQPDFGADLRGLLFELITPATKILAKRKIIEEIQRWEPRAVVDDITIVTEEAFGTLNITVAISLAARPEITTTVTVNLERIR